MSTRELAARFLGRDPTDVPRWPPDLFAVCAGILVHSGCYRSVVELTGPDDHPLDEHFVSRVSELGRAWRRVLVESTGDQLPEEADALPIPGEHIARLWAEVLHFELATVDQHTPAIRALVELVAICDEASAGCGVRSRVDSFLDLATERLVINGQRSVCIDVSPEVAMVLPKQHTPQRGMSLRSLTHHLAYVRRTGVTPRWQAPLNLPANTRRKLELFNILILPWPMAIDRTQFKGVHLEDLELRCAPPTQRHRYFTFTPQATVPEVFERELRQALTAARHVAEDVDLVVFPELALTEELLERTLNVLGKEESALIAGVAGQRGAVGLNEAILEFSQWLGGDVPRAIVRQRKHHRWCLDLPQVQMYSLQGRMPGSKDHWELTELANREIHFHTVTDWLTLSTLICEDLARQDPVADVIRAIGPNLVVALLLDGPQIGSRWSGRYATVLAEDPGCSVLTVTSLGMSLLTREHAAQRGWTDHSRSVALWRDVENGEQVVALPEGANGAVLHVIRRAKTEYTADGRGDGGSAFFPVLSGWTPIFPTTGS